ncbi:MAG: hypothetical protein M1827_003866 [Pycnora praestabilis]|nr:MAG: hypothetical protein M1827_003866 [Pycnora praestabilis]
MPQGLCGPIPASVSDRHLRPGGYIEQVEISPFVQLDPSSLANDPVLHGMRILITEAGRRFGKTFEVEAKMKEWIEEAGFVDVVEKRYKWPIGSSSRDPKLKEIGRWNQLNWEEGLEGWSMALLTRVMGWSYTEVQSWMAQVKTALRDHRHHAFQDVAVVYARKPG